MFVNKDSIEIDGVSMGQYLVEAKFGYNKLWGEDSGRNLNGDMVATLIGIYPKLTLQFRKLTKGELHTLAPIFDSARQEVTYHDATKGRDVTLTTYTNDWEIVNKTIVSNGRTNEGFSVSFISCYKR